MRLHDPEVVHEAAVREWNNLNNPSQKYLINNPNQVAAAAEMAFCDALGLDFERERFPGRHDGEPWQFVINGSRIKVYAAPRYQWGHMIPEIKPVMADTFVLMWSRDDLMHFAGWLPRSAVAAHPVRVLTPKGKPSYCVPWRALNPKLGALRQHLGLDYTQGSLL